MYRYLSRGRCRRKSSSKIDGHALVRNTAHPDGDLVEGQAVRGLFSFDGRLPDMPVASHLPSPSKIIFGLLRLVYDGTSNRQNDLLDEARNTSNLYLLEVDCCPGQLQLSF
jgi:hypothetical protein